MAKSGQLLAILTLKMESQGKPMLSYKNLQKCKSGSFMGHHSQIATSDLGDSSEPVF